MTPIYIGYNFKISPLQPATDILIAELGNLGFESFVETEVGLNAYIQKEDWHSDILNDVFVLNSDEFEITHQFEKIEQVNWNEEWEKNFDPISVDGKCRVRAPFHEKCDEEFDIVIEPKMSFGTGHHATTHMMIQYLLKLPLENIKTLDMGCGTGVLAILARMRGANPVEAIDIDNWCYLNTLENIERNNCNDITVYEGDASLLTNKSYQLIIANINRNILLTDMAIYAKCLEDNGTILLSGFYNEDLKLIVEECAKSGLIFVDNLEKDNWISAKFVKK